MADPVTPKCGNFGNLNAAKEPCKSYVIKGTTACLRHTGKSVAKARAQAAIRTAIDEWGISSDDYIDPADTFLKLIAQSARRVQRYSAAIAAGIELSANAPDWQHTGEAIKTELANRGYDPSLSVLLAPQYSVTAFGEKVYIGQQLSALTKLEAEERDRLAGWCQKAVAAGIEERRVKLAEQQGLNIATVIRLFTQQLGLTAEQRELIPAALRDAVGAVFGTSKVIEGQTA